MPEYIITILIGTLLTVIGYLINDKLSGIKDALKDLKDEISKLNELYHDHEVRIQKLEDEVE
ncbi:MAG: hypothetical protein KDC73_05990 [Ignavibacteriae bacterium]|nr:hypothetical protein [Ignavibacteriota bacterium]MCB0724234.1 hypothetical protein [Ignavibacteriota bacterium]MCB9243722.1 hypothetical protein [Ignavibacteriales bacterium]